MSISETVPWYEKSFGEDYLLVYKHRNQQEADQVVQQVLEWLKLPSGSQDLDLCCGAGRHALALANAGYRVTGVDLSSVLLRRARELDLEKRVRWVEADMRALPADDHFIENFDAVVNLFTSFGYFGADREQLDVLRQIRRALKPGGRFVMDVLNAGYIQDHLVPFSRREESGVIISERRQIHSGFVTKRIMIEDGDKEPRSYTERVKLYALKAMGSMLIDAGLVIDEVYGSYDADAYHERYSPRMLIVGHRV